MASIQTGIELQDQFSNVIMAFTNGLMNAISTANQFSDTMSQNINTSGLENVHDEVQSVTNDLNSLNRAAENPLNLGSDRANSELEQLRSQLSQAIDEQNEMNQAIERMDVQGANADYLQLSRTIGSTEAYLRDNVNEQGRFNREVDEATERMNGLEGAVQKVVAAIGGMFAIQKVVGFINDCTDAADIQINAQKQLAATLSNMGGSEDDYNALVKKAQDIQAAGMYGDEALIGAAAEFATYMNDTTAIEMMMDTLTNYAAGMSGGGAIDYDSMVDYATNLGKITTGAYDAMTKKGFEFTEAQKAVIDGTATEAQYVEALGNEWQSMSDDMMSATIIADIINESWDGLYATMSDTPEAQLQSLKNSFGDIQEMVGNRLYPTLGNLYSIIINNLPLIESVMMSAANGLGVIINILSYIIQGICEVASFTQENWSVISPIIYAVVGALSAYLAVLAIYNTISVISAAITAAKSFAASVHAASLMMEAGATFTATAAQHGLNAALLACPLTWIILLVIALIAVVVAVTNHIADMGGTATTAFGVITGGINVVIQFFWNLLLVVLNIVLGIGSAVWTLGSNIMAAFYNAISAVQSWWYGLLSTALSVISQICAELNKLPFVEFDYSGVVSAADDYASKAAAAAGDKMEYKSIADAFSDGFTTFDAFQDGWVSDAYNAGAAWGDGVSNKVAEAFTDASTYIPQAGDYANAFAGTASDNAATAQNTGDTAKAAQKAAQSLDISGEDLKYIKDLAEREYINRFTTAKINVKQTNNNTVNSNMDLDGINEYLRSDLEQRMAAVAEGVH